MSLLTPPIITGASAVLNRFLSSDISETRIFFPNEKK